VTGASSNSEADPSSSPEKATTTKRSASVFGLDTNQGTMFVDFIPISSSVNLRLKNAVFFIFTFLFFQL
jgi:hypothetical protein